MELFIQLTIRVFNYHLNLQWFKWIFKINKTFQGNFYTAIIIETLESFLELLTRGLLEYLRITLKIRFSQLSSF